ncbi:MAG: glycine cleavage system protein H [Gammaproteobacteria bacterium]|jgi:glycine cleavage system H protein|nr:glycine cleavage system protein H [Gammaproteobacteria bacterium]|tara:strand:+ start:8115 stop:8510 length:396 start_codon:yes stop_codon:yes gene_type:complete
MAEFPEELRFAKTHEWARLESDGSVTIGISDYAQEALGDVVYVELPETNTSLKAEGEAGVIESVKAASDYYSPISGTVIETNSELEDNPEIVNDAPYDTGWLFRLKPGNSAELNSLMNTGEYRQLCEEDDH